MKHRTFLFLSIALSCTMLQAQQICNPPLGATLAPLRWSHNPSNWFVDYMKMSQPSFATVSGPWDPGAAATDAEGWPIEPFSIWVKLGLYPQDEGEYHLEFEGFAQISAFGDHLVTDQIYDSIANKTTAKLQVTVASNQIALKFDAPMSPVVRHIKLISPGFDPKNHPTFHPDWVEHVSRFPVLRFMNWNAANFNTAQHWSDRNTPDSPTQCPSYFTTAPIPTPGVAWEYVTELANLAGSDIWICVPINATDDYVQQLAQFLLSYLQPGAKIYVEYANEVWNANEYPYHQNKNAAIAEVQQGNSNLNFDGENNPDVWAARRYARRSKEIAEMMVQVFGQNALFSRVFPVFGYHVVSPGYSLDEGLEFIKAQYGVPKNYFWGVAGAPFLNGNGMSPTGLTRDKYFEYMQQQMGRMFGNTDNFLDAGVAYATYYDLRYMAHEAGTDTYFFGDQYPEALKDTIAAAQDDPRMKTLIEEYLSNWFRYGGREGLFTWFVAGATDWKDGDTYGLVKDRLHLNNAKTEAIDKILADQCPFQNAGHPVPGVIDARQYVQYPENWDAQPYNMSMFQGNTHQYLLNVSDSCLYHFALVAEKPGLADSKFEVLLDDITIDTLVIPGNQMAGIDTFFVGGITLNQGLHTLRLRYLNWCYGTHKLIFSPAGGCAVAVQYWEKSAFAIFPNPASNGFYIKPEETLAGRQMLYITDVLGRTVLQKTLNLSLNEVIWVETPLTPGLYFIKIAGYVARLELGR